MKITLLNLLTAEMLFKEKAEGGECVKHEDTWGKSILAKRSKCKGPEIKNF